MTSRDQPQDLDERMQRADALYQDKLKAILEPEYNNKFIAIEPDSGEYAVADSTGNAMRAMHSRFPSHPLLLKKIGPEPEYDLAARIFASDMRASNQIK